MDFLAALLLVEIIVATISVAYIVGIYFQTSRTSRVFRMLVQADIVKVIAGFWIGGLAMFRLLPFPERAQLPTWTVPVSGFVVMALLAPVIYHAWTIRGLRQRYGDGTPPPFHEAD